jgi:protein-tyrosine-phosphatase
MTKKVGIFCRLNAARSPVLEALLSHQNASYTFFSGGILGKEGIGLPRITKDFAKSLGLTNLKDYSNNVRNQEKWILEADLLLGADDLTCQILEKIHPGQQFHSIEGRARETGVRLVDPVNSSDYEFNHLLGRFLYFGLSTFQEFEGQNNQFPISALVANQDNIQSELEIFLESQSVSEPNLLIVDCNFKFAIKCEYRRLVPETQQYESAANAILKLKEENLCAISLISPSHEVTSWEGFMASLEWKKWLIKISRSRPILLLCTPVDIIKGEKHNSFLEAFNSDRLIYRA